MSEEKKINPRKDYRKNNLHGRKRYDFSLNDARMPWNISAQIPKLHIDVLEQEGLLGPASPLYGM